MKKIIPVSVCLSLLLFSVESVAVESEQPPVDQVQTSPAEKSPETEKSASLAKEPLDRIVAIVNESVITNNELDTQVNLVKETLARRQMPLPPEEILRKQVLQHMVDTELEMQMAKNVGVNVDSHDVDEAIARIAQQNNVSLEALHKATESQGLSWKDYRHNIKKELIVSQLQQKAVGAILVTDQEVDTYLASTTGSSSANMSNSYHLEDILIPLPADPSSQEVQAAQKRANEVLARLKNGANFNELAVAESGGNDALEGGDLGYRQLPELPEAFATEVEHMQPGDLSDPIRTSNGWHIIKLVDVKAGSGGAAPSKEQIKRFLYQRKFNEALENWMLKIRGASYVQIFL